MVQQGKVSVARLPFKELRSSAESEAIARAASAATEIERGAVFTRPEVVRAALDMAGYTTTANLVESKLLEPSFGGGEFLSEVATRLVSVYLDQSGSWRGAAKALAGCVFAVELHKTTYSATKERLCLKLEELGSPAATAKEIVNSWLYCDDFLLADIDGDFDFVVGNPPYVRQERIAKPLLTAYRERYDTLYDRADLYVLFFERGLDLLKPGGTLAYVCADRWTKNKYGGPLRKKISDSFSLRAFVSLSGLDAFDKEVEAYASIAVIAAGQGQTDSTLVCSGPRKEMGEEGPCHENFELVDGTRTKLVAVSRVVNGKDPWLLDAFDALPVIRLLEERYPSLEESGASVGIGVATGCDRVFIGEYADLPIEPSRKLRLAIGRDCKQDGVAWSGKGLVNPYLPDGSLVDLGDYPMLAEYLEQHKEALVKRHVAKKSPQRWYKTIDRVYPGLTTKEKLLIPDIKGSALVTYDPGKLYPHHNLYVITSDDWELRALQTILRSSIAIAFVSAYCTRMSGGYLRFQAQYLRRIRVPNRQGLSQKQLDGLSTLNPESSQLEIDEVVLPLYGLDVASARSIQEFAESSKRGTRK